MNNEKMEKNDSSEKIENLQLTDITRNPYQPRVSFDETKLTELAASIKENGVMQPIIVRRSKVIGYELLAGERRFLASQKAGLTTIPAIVRDYDDQEMMTLSIVENLQRENLNTMEEAQSLANLSQKAGLTHEEIAKILGKSRAYVSNSIRLLQLPTELQYLVEKKNLSAAHARTLLGLSDTPKQLEFARRVIKKNLSVRQLEALVYGEENENLSTISADKPQKNPYVEEMERHLKENLGNTVVISTNQQNKGQLSIHFDNLNDLENLIQKLEK